MDDSIESASFEAWFEHQAWVRALALRLCAEPSAADDVVQDTWVEVMRGGGTARSTRTWLGGVVRHLARRSRRRDEARSEREAHAAKRDEMPSSDTLLAQAELQQRVLAAVASLDEAHRVVVLMRYYEGASGEEIARRLGVPSSTVRNRLARAHEKLRSKLDRDYGGERKAWSAAFAPALAFKSSAVLATGVGVAMKVQLAIAAAAVIVAAVFLWPRPAADREARGARASELASVSQLASSIDAARTDERAPVAIETAPASSLAAIEHVLVFGDVLGTDGTKVEGSLSFVDQATGDSRDATLSAHNSYSIFGLRPGTYRIASWERGFVPLDETLVLPSDQPKLRHDLTLERAFELPVNIVERATGEPLDTSWGSWRSGLGAVATLERPMRIAGVHGTGPLGAGVGAWYATNMFRTHVVGRAGTKSATHDASTLDKCAGVLEVWAKPPFYVSCVLRDVVLESRLIRGDEKELTFELDSAELETKLASLSVRCVDAATGRPIEGASVQATTQDTSGSGVATEASGIVRIDKLVPGMLQIEVEAQGFAPIAHWRRFGPGENVDLGTLALVPAAHLRGRVVDAEGHGVSVAMTAFGLGDDVAPRDLHSLMGYSSASDGSFKIDWAPSGRVRLLVRDEKWALTALDVDASGGALDNLELRLERGTEIWLQSPRGPHQTVDVLVVDARGRPLDLRGLYPPSGSRFRLAPGHYELWTIDDDTVVSRRALDIGTERVVLEVAAP